MKADFQKSSIRDAAQRMRAQPRETGIVGFESDRDLGVLWRFHFLINLLRAHAAAASQTDFHHFDTPGCSMAVCHGVDFGWIPGGVRSA